MSRRHGERRTKVHCTIYFNPSVMIAFLNLHTEPHQLPLKTASSGHSFEIAFDDSKGSFFAVLIPSPPPTPGGSKSPIDLGRNSCPLPERLKGRTQP